MYFEFKFDGVSEEFETYIGDDEKVVRNGIRDIQFLSAGPGNTYNFSWYGKDGFDNYWFFTQDNGRIFDIPFYIGNEIFKKEYNSKDETVFYNTRIIFGTLGPRGGLTAFNKIESVKEVFLVRLAQYDENMHTNVAQFNIHFTKKKNEKIKYDITFVGFKKK